MQTSSIDTLFCYVTLEGSTANYVLATKEIPGMYCSELLNGTAPLVTFIKALRAQYINIRWICNDRPYDTARSLTEEEMRELGNGLGAQVERIWTPFTLYLREVPRPVVNKKAQKKAEKRARREAARMESETRKAVRRAEHAEAEGSELPDPDDGLPF